jgi:hypothetical protein
MTEITEQRLSRERIIWFCTSCGSANPFFDAEFESKGGVFAEKDTLDCRDCGDSLKADGLIFNIERFIGMKPVDSDKNKTSDFLYWND